MKGPPTFTDCGDTVRVLSSRSKVGLGVGVGVLAQVYTSEVDNLLGSLLPDPPYMTNVVCVPPEGRTRVL